LNVDVNVTSPSTRAQAQGTISASQSEAVVVRIQGVKGSADVSLQAGATREQVVAAINSFTEQTGVEATSEGIIRSTDYGSEATVRVENVQGTLAGITPGLARGTDVQAEVNGVQLTGVANTINVSLGNLTAQIDVQAGQSGNFSFSIRGGGATFQIGPEGSDKITVGFSSVQSAVLGTSSGKGNLQSITTGGSNNILDNPVNALSIIQAARNEVITQRSQIGSTAASIFEPSVRALQANVINLSQSRSVVADTDFAREIGELIRSQVLRQSGINILRAQTSSAGAVLNLLA
jgi:flagellin